MAKHYFPKFNKANVTLSPFQIRKKILLFYVLFALMPSCLMGYGQSSDYIPMVNQGAVWFETYTNYSWPPSPYGYSYCGRKYLDGDTIINDNMYSKIYHEVLDIYCTDIIVSEPEYAGAIREDIPEQKVWFFPPEYPDEVLYFDFTLSTGDTVSWYSWFNGGSNMYLTVSDIDTITTFDGLERRRWLFDEEPLSEESSMIEGIGCSSGLLANYEVIFEYWNYLISQSIDTSLSYCRNFNVCEIPTDTCATVGVEPSYDNSHILIYPNPVIAGNPLRITGIPNPKNEPVIIALYDILGNKVEAYNSTSVNLLITSPKIPGLYLINIYTSTLKSQIKILVKQ